MYGGNYITDALEHRTMYETENVQASEVEYNRATRYWYHCKKIKISEELNYLTPETLQRRFPARILSDEEMMEMLAQDFPEDRFDYSKGY